MPAVANFLDKDITAYCKFLDDNRRIVDCVRLSRHCQPWLSRSESDCWQFGRDTVSDGTQWCRHQLCSEHLWRSFSSCLTIGIHYPLQFIHYLLQGTCRSLKVLELFSRFIRPWKSLKMLEFDLLILCASTSDFQCNHRISIKKIFSSALPQNSCPSTFNLLLAPLIW